MLVSFNLRLRYHEAMDCIDQMIKLGGDAAITVGGSWYKGTEEQIDDLIAYMCEKDYDVDSMTIDGKPREATKRNIENMKTMGIIKDGR
jgi:hypothetical protein